MTNSNTNQNEELDKKLAEILLKNREEIISQLNNAKKSLRTLMELALRTEEEFTTGYDLISLIDVTQQRIRNIEGVFQGNELKEDIEILA